MSKHKQKSHSFNRYFNTHFEELRQIIWSHKKQLDFAKEISLMLYVPRYGVVFCCLFNRMSFICILITYLCHNYFYNACLFGLTAPLWCWIIYIVFCSRSILIACCRLWRLEFISDLVETFSAFAIGSTQRPYDHSQQNKKNVPNLFLLTVIAFIVEPMNSDSNISPVQLKYFFYKSLFHVFALSVFM